jgi:hypothetical protein
MKNALVALAVCAAGLAGAVVEGRSATDRPESESTFNAEREARALLNDKCPERRPFSVTCTARAPGWFCEWDSRSAEGDLQLTQYESGTGFTVYC